MESGRHFAIERRKAALVLADTLLVDPYIGAIVGRADVQEGSHIRLRLEVEITLIPNDAFIAKQRRILGIPVTGNLEGGGVGEIVFLSLAFAHQRRMLIEPVSVVAHRAIWGVKASAGWIDQVVPIPIEAGRGTMVDVNDKGLQRLLRKDGNCAWTAEEHCQNDATTAKS